MSCFVYYLSNPELAFLIIANAANSDSSAEISKHTIISFVDNGLESFDLFAQLFVAASSGVDLGCQHVQLLFDMLQLLGDASSTTFDSILGRGENIDTSTSTDHIPGHFGRQPGRILNARSQE